MIAYCHTTFIISRIQIDRNMSYLSSSNLYALLHILLVCVKIYVFDWLIDQSFTPSRQYFSHIIAAKIYDMTLRTINLMKSRDVKQLRNVYSLVIYTLTVLDMEHFLQYTKILIYVEYSLYIIEGLSEKK